MFAMRGGNTALVKRGRTTYVAPPSPLSIPRYWGHYGDSQTSGRESEATAKNPKECFKRMWEAEGFDSILGNDTSSDAGVSGRSLAGALTYLLTRTFAGTPWIHVQESGNQNLDGQRTASEWGGTFQQGWVDIEARWPGCFKSYETAHSFSPARKAQAYRNWDAYNTELRSRVATLAGLGIDVKIVETEYYIDFMIAELGYDAVCFPDTDPNAYHYQGIGNFTIALAMFKRFNYDVTTLDHSTINLNASHKATAVSIVAAS